MVTKAINTFDLQNLKNELRLEYQWEFKEFRHTFWGKIQDDYNKIDEKVTKYNTDVLLTNQAFINMSDKFDEIKIMIVQLSNKIEWFSDKFVTHSELIPIQEKQKSHDDTIAWVVRGIVVAFLSLIAWLVWLSKYM